MNLSLCGLLGLSLLAFAPAAASPMAGAPLLAARLLPEKVIYCRAASFQAPGDWTGFVAQWKTWIGQGAQGTVLDLRSNGAPDDFAGAARLAALFTPPGTPLFTVRDQEPTGHAYAAPSAAISVAGPLAVLIDSRTSGAGEALAACLKANGALLLGQPTLGKDSRFGPRPLSVPPDINLSIDVKQEDAILALIAQDRVLDVIGEASGSHRLSEAALVRGEDPEVEAYLISHDPASAPVPRDAVLLAALDSLTAIRLSRETPSVTSLPPSVR